MSFNQIADKIKKLGLSEKEAIVYAYILGVHGAFPSDIASKTHLNRSTVYKVLISLSVKGLVAEVEKNKKIFYQAETPKKLRYFAKHRLEDAELAYSSTEEIIPLLEKFFNKEEGKSNVTFYEGKAKVIEVYLRHIEVEKGYKMTAFANVVGIKKFLPAKIFHFYKKEKERLGITARGITSSNPYSYQFQKDTHTGIKRNIWPELRFVPEELFPFPAEITMFDNNKVSIIKFDEENPIGIVIEDKMVHDMMNMLFEFIWKIAKDK